jgi:hypothetical protein
VSLNYTWECGGPGTEITKLTGGKFDKAETNKIDFIIFINSKRFLLYS